MRVGPALAIGHQHDCVTDLYGGVHDFVFHARLWVTRLRFGAILETHQHLNFCVERALVKLDGFFAAAFKKQISLDSRDGHNVSRFGFMDWWEKFSRKCPRAKIRALLCGAKSP